MKSVIITKEEVLSQPQAIRRKRDIHRADRLFSLALKLPSFAIFLLLGVIAYFLGHGAWQVLIHTGPSFFWDRSWDPVQEKFGALAFIFGTVISSILSILIATPLSVGAALFLAEVAPKRMGQAFGFLIEMLAAIPSVVYGLWGIFVLVPFLRTTLEPLLGNTLGVLPFFQGPFYGVGMLAAGIILAIMITPTICTITREIFLSIPRTQREAAYALGATRWEMIRVAVLQSSRSGIGGAVILGLGRALGETMAVTMVIGNRADISWSLFAPAQTMASVIANEYAEAAGDAHLSALAAIGFTLFGVTLVVNGLARLLIHQRRQR